MPAHLKAKQPGKSAIFPNSDAYVDACDHVFWCDARPHESRALKSGALVFCKIDEVWRLFRALRRTRKRIVLLTGEGDKPVSPELYAQKPPHVHHWFGTNMFADGTDTTAIPLGLGARPDSATLESDEIRKAAALGIKRDQLLYANFGTASNPGLREPLSAWLQRPEQSWITRHPHTAQPGKAGYLEALLSHHFVFCPPGNGEDTHRMWETLYCGAIPVVRESPAMRHFKDLPILFVPQFDGLSEQFLRDELSAWPQRHFSREKLGMDYWKARFSAAQQAALIRGPLNLKEWCGAWIKEIRLVAGRHVGLTVA